MAKYGLRDKIRIASLFNIFVAPLIMMMPANAETNIFKCIDPEGNTTFQETACDGGVETRYDYKDSGTSSSRPVEDNLIENLGAAAPARSPQRKNTSPTTAEEKPGLSLKQQKQCDRWQDEMSDIGDQQRRGYTAEEGEKQRRRLRRLRRNIARQNCPRSNFLR